jgi:hypothetical protein
MRSRCGWQKAVVFVCAVHGDTCALREEGFHYNSTFIERRNIMKRILMSLAFVLLVVSAVFAQEFDPMQGSSVQLGLRLGFGYAKNSQMNELMHALGDYETASMNAFMKTYYPTVSGTFENKKSEADWNLGLDFEPRFFFLNFAVGLSIGYHATNGAESNIEHTVYTDSVNYTMQLTCIPLLGTFYYRMNASDSVVLLLGAGGGYYLATIEYKFENKFSLSTTNGDSETLKFKGNALGAHARFELNYILHPFTLYGGVEGRYVKFSEFKDGSDTLVNVDGGKLSAQLTGVFFYFGASVLI